MVGRQAMIRAVERHCQTLSSLDKEGWLGLWAQDAVLEDPVSVDTFRRAEALRSTFWPIVEACSPVRLTPMHGIIVCGNDAVAILAVDSSWGGTTRSVGPIVDHFTFDAEGEIASMRAHWHFAKAGYRPELDTPSTQRARMTGTLDTLYRATREGDFDAWIAVWADDAEIEDPVGSPPWRGIDAIRTDFWSIGRTGQPRATLLEDYIVSGNEVVAVLEAEVGPADARSKVGPIVVDYTFDERGKIARLRSFFNG